MSHKELTKLIQGRFAANRDIPKQLGVPLSKWNKLAMAAKAGDQSSIDVLEQWAMKAKPTAYSQAEFDALRKALISQYGGIVQALIRNEKPRRPTKQIEKFTKLILS